MSTINHKTWLSCNHTGQEYSGSQSVASCCSFTVFLFQCVDQTGRRCCADPRGVSSTRPSRGALLPSVIKQLPVTFCDLVSVSLRDSRPARYLTFSKDGTLCADGSVVSTFDLPKTALLEFSPLNNILVTWQPYTKTQDSPQGDANLQLWELPSGRLVKALYQKKVDSWCPKWTEDEKVCVRSVNNELHFFENNDFNSIANKLHMQKVSDFAVSSGPQPCKVAIYVPGSKGAPSFVRLYQYPVLGGPGAALANKSFFKADKVAMQWNQKASAVLVTASTEVDKSGASYYGEQTLHYLGVNGETALVQLAKNGPIYDAAWSPNSSEFCVVYGFMPAKATVFNLKCEAVFDFGTGPRNAAYYSPQGHILVLAGFGNLRGKMEVWDVKKYKQVSTPQAPDATFFSWCPDGEHIVTATCAPRLRVSNGYKIWHYTGSVLQKHDVAEGAELRDVRWQPFPDGTFPERPIRYQVATSELGSTQAAPTQAYRPPALRHLPAAPSSKLEAKPDPEPQSAPAPVSHSQSEASGGSGDPEMDKKIKNLNKKLRAIEELKEQQASGKVLQKNQVEKIQKEEQLLKELQALQVKP
uniref:Eukaryotic translation initiation factor 2A n=1 Tax=Poecilia reticulata TaxID=8081 RepID=A0A3P9QEI9_POERE